MKILLRPLITLLAASLLLCAQAAPATQLYTVKVGDFTRLKVIDGINVDYICSTDSAGTATFEATEQMAPNIGFSNNKGELTISLTVNDVSTTGRPTVTVRSPFLTSVNNQGDSLMRVLSVAPCPTFSAKQVGNGRTVVRDIRATKVNASLETGNGTVALYGTCETAVLSLTGTGTLQADGLKASEVRCRAFGTGTIGCWADKLLKVGGISSTRIYYGGNPEIKKSAVAIGIKIEPLP